MLSQTLIKHLDEYSSYHEHPMNRLCHKIGVPLVIFHVVAMLDWISLFEVGTVSVSLGVLMLPLVIGWYMTLNLRYALILALVYGACFPLGRMTPTSIVWAITVVAWALQFAGHLIWEKKSPAFFKNLPQLLVGPLFVTALLLGDWPQRNSTEDA